MPLYVLLLLPTFRGENQVENFQGFYPFACPHQLLKISRHIATT